MPHVPPLQQHRCDPGLLAAQVSIMSCKAMDAGCSRLPLSAALSCMEWYASPDGACIGGFCLDPPCEHHLCRVALQVQDQF